MSRVHLRMSIKATPQDMWQKVRRTKGRGGVMSSKLRNEGPIYGAPIPTSPIRLSPMMKQAVPGRDELQRARDQGFERLVAAYEVMASQWMLYEWATEMHCQLFRDADATRTDIWLLVDIDGNVLGRGDTPVEAIHQCKHELDMSNLGAIQFFPTELSEEFMELLDDEEASEDANPIR